MLSDDITLRKYFVLSAWLLFECSYPMMLEEHKALSNRRYFFQRYVYALLTEILRWDEIYHRFGYLSLNVASQLSDFDNFALILKKKSEF